MAASSAAMRLLLLSPSPRCTGWLASRALLSDGWALCIPWAMLTCACHNADEWSHSMVLQESIPACKKAAACMVTLAVPSRQVSTMPVKGFVGMAKSFGDSIEVERAPQPAASQALPRW